MTPVTLDPNVLTALHTVAGNDEVDAVVGIINEFNGVHSVADAEQKLKFLVGIFSRLAARGSVTTENGTYRVG